MSTAEANDLSDVLNRVKDWPPAQRITLARRILETVETHPTGAPPRTGSLKGLIGILKTGAPPPTDDECRAMLEEELIKKHLK
jgi:hypothetical protein